MAMMKSVESSGELSAKRPRQERKRGERTVEPVRGGSERDAERGDFERELLSSNDPACMQRMVSELQGTARAAGKGDRPRGPHDEAKPAMNQQLAKL